MEDSHSSHLQGVLSAIDSKYEIPEKANENVLMTLGKDVEMQTFKTNVTVGERDVAMSQNADEQSSFIVILCVGTITGKDTVFVKDNFRRTPPKGSFLPTVCMDIHLKKIKSPQSEGNALSVIEKMDPDPEGYAGFNFKSCHGALVFWVPEHSSSLIEAAKWKQAIVEFANSQIPCVLVAFNSTNLQWMGKGKMFESKVALEEFCRDHGFAVKNFEMKSRCWDGEVFEQALTCLMDQIKSGQKT